MPVTETIGVTGAFPSDSVVSHVVSNVKKV